MHSILKRATTAALLVTAAAAAAGAQVTAQFFTGIPLFTPGVGANFNPANLVCTRNLATVDFPNATSLANACGPGMGLTGFSQSARFTGGFQAPASGMYSINICRDDGIALYVNSAVVTEQFFDQATCSSFATFLNAGANAFRLDYYANGFGGSTVQIGLPNGVTFAQVAAVPEPATVVLLASGLLAVAGVARRWATR